MPMEDTPTPMEPTTSARVMLRPSLRLMPLFCMALMATLTAMVPTPMASGLMPMEDTPTPMVPMVPTPMASGLMPMEDTPTPMEPTTSASVMLRPSLRLMPLFCMQALMATLIAMVPIPM